MLIEPQVSTMSVVLLGSFNPAIVDPYWLKAQEFISEELRDEAQIDIVSPQITRFRVGNFLFDVTSDRMQIAAINPPFILLQDLVVKLLGDVLPHIKINIFGLNRTVHFSVGKDVRHKIGRLLAPVEPWGEWAKEWSGRAFPYTSGTVDVAMSEIHPDDPYKRKTTANVQPSMLIKNDAGIFMNVNDNYEVPDQSGGKIAPILSEVFEPFVERSEWIIDQMMKLKDATS